VGKVLLITGLPATGKSSFARFLFQKHGFAVYDVERYPEGWARPELYPEWREDRAGFALRLREQHPSGVVLDWGFPPACLPRVEELEGAGVQCAWCTGDRDKLRARFVARGGVPVEDFDTQLDNIDRAGLPGHRKWPTIVTLDAEGRAPDWEDVWHELVRLTASPSLHDPGDRDTDRGLHTPGSR
jgi:hypothetical protein